MSVIKSNHGGLGGSGAPGGALGSFYSHTIDQSLRMDDASGGYLTISSASPTATNRKKVTISCWVKRAGISVSGVNTVFWSTVNGLMLQFFTADSIYIYDNNAGGWQSTVTNGGRIFRDPSAWYHLALIIDTTQSTAADRAKFYINGELQTLNSYPGLNTDITWHDGSTMRIGSVGDAQDLAGYIAEFISIDGQDVSISDLGETKDGVWIPKNVSGLTLGNAGFYLKFDNSSDIGNDSGSNNIDFTATNLVAADVVLDSPTNNFAIMNNLYHSASKAVLHEGALKVDGIGFVNAAHGYGAVSSFVIPKDKKIYIEVECTDADGAYYYVGFASQSGLESGPSSTNVGGSNAITLYNRQVYINGTEIDYGASAGLGGLGVAKLAAGDILGCMCDGATGKVWFSRNGSYFKSPTTDNSGTTGDPAGGNHPVGTITNGATEDIFLVVGTGTGASNVFVNFGQDSVNVASAQSDEEGIGTFEYAPPTGFLALCSSNLSDPTIGPGQSEQADDNFNTVLYTGNASSRSITGVGFQPDWVWLKPRSDTDNHVVFDSVRGVQKFLYVNGTGAEGTRSGDGLSSFDSDGFSIGDWNNINESSQTYVAWNWKAGGSASSNSDGGTTSSVSANTDAGFSILTYTADAATGTVGHGLNSAPELVIGRPRSDTNWYVMHTPGGVVPANNILNLDSNAAAFNPGVNHFNDTYPTSTVVSYGGYMGNSLSNDDKLMYCFHSVEGYSKVGSFLGNGSSQFVYLGFRPAFILWKRTNSSSWNISDSVRDPFNEVSAILHPNSTASETTASQDILFVSNGFVEAGYANDSGTTSIYWAIAEAPLKFANAR
jgi:hypothetical protein